MKVCMLMSPKVSVFLMIEITTYRDPAESFVASLGIIERTIHESKMIYAYDFMFSAWI